MTDRCPFCGTPGEYVTADEGTSYFAPTPDPLLDVGPRDPESWKSGWNAAVKAYRDGEMRLPTPDPLTPEAEDNKAALESLPYAVQGADLNRPARVIVCQHGHYWRDYGEFWSMCPVSDDNEVCNPEAVYLLAPTPDPLRDALAGDLINPRLSEVDFGRFTAWLEERLTAAMRSVLWPTVGAEPSQSWLDGKVRETVRDALASKEDR